MRIAVAAISLLVVGIIYRVYQIDVLARIFTKALNESTMILMIMAGASLFGFVCSDLYVTQSLAELILSLPVGKWGIMLFINLLLLVLGCFIPPAAVILMVAPMLLPVIKGLGFDSVWFSVIMTVNLEVGLVTPPVGLNLYVASGISGLGLTDTTKACLPWILVMLLYLLLLTYVPIISPWLPAVLMGAAT